MTMAAPNWAPPTALQEGDRSSLSKGWITQNNEINNSKTQVSASRRDFYRVVWTRIGTKQGTQHERDVVFNALRIGWNKDNIGSHIVRNNVIHDCEQAGSADTWEQFSAHIQQSYI